jgi:SAM-dependent methyltransferase
MSYLRTLQSNWEGLAQRDPFWAICSDPQKRDQQWDRASFFATGEAEVSTVLEHLRALGLAVDYTGGTLDFGCGVGRLTQALARRFQSCHGVDISPTMICLARECNQYPATCQYLVNDSDQLSLSWENQFSFVYTSIVLQHIQPTYTMNYLREFIRVLRPGGILVFQIPDSHIADPRAQGDRRSGVKQLVRAARGKLRLRTHLRHWVGSLTGEGSNTPQQEFHMEMYSAREASVRSLIESARAQVVDVRLTNSTDIDFNGRLRYLDEEPQEGWVSKQYCVVKSPAE